MHYKDHARTLKLVQSNYLSFGYFTATVEPKLNSALRHIIYLVIYSTVYNETFVIDLLCHVSTTTVEHTLYIFKVSYGARIQTTVTSSEVSF